MSAARRAHARLHRAQPASPNPHRRGPGPALAACPPGRQPGRQPARAASRGRMAISARARRNQDRAVTRRIRRVGVRAITTGRPRFVAIEGKIARLSTEPEQDLNDRLELTDGGTGVASFRGAGSRREARRLSPSKCSLMRFSASVTSPGGTQHRAILFRAPGRTLLAAVVVGPGKVRAARCQPAWWRSGCRGRCLDKCQRSGLRRSSHARWRRSGNSRRRGSRCRGRALRRARRYRLRR
jgi:hypothetical protein